LAIGFVFLAIRDRAIEVLIYAAFAVILAVLAAYFGRREIKKLRYEYRYSDDDTDDSMGPS
jgi:hypothetical protein